MSVLNIERAAHKGIRDHVRVTIRASTAMLIVGAALVLLAILTPVPVDWWLKAFSKLTDFWLAAAIATLGAAALTFGLRLRRHPRSGRPPSAAPLPPDRQLRPIPTWTFPVGAIIIVLVTWIAVLWLQSAAPKGTNPQAAQLRINAIRTGLSVGAGAVGALALLLALRRQQLAERSQQATEYDAGEKRVTELYVKAAEQLGSEKAPVRLAGLYALERLAQANPMHRQSITEVICAYLRMPLPIVYGEGESSDDVAEQSQHAEKWGGERQVRLAAQRLLVKHAKNDAQTVAEGAFWGSLNLDLAEATLIDADFSGTQIGSLNCRGSKFLGHASFRDSTFHKRPDFRAAKFSAEATFTGARFALGADFIQVHFQNRARFNKTKFEGEADFTSGAFENVTFFDNSSFLADGDFSFCTFRDSTRFFKTKFGNDVWFDNGRFLDRLAFDGTAFGGDASFDSSRFEGTTFFRVSEIKGSFEFTAAVISKKDGARANVWPQGWRETENGEGLEREQVFEIEVE
ncbi:hypothetical protein [Micromonospora sp. WMMA2032]|uniref:pentapeptide repeat-containing protein n=1 Tax=Micromonospora sp. WMMA2032 TaxID=2039870 RepID=UPI0012FD529D|nr:hypothetical protein [Micromonospora sp. WMMA2032]